MKKNNTVNSAALTELLLSLDFLLRLSGRAYEKYMANKIYLHALNIRKANKMIYQQVIDKAHLIPLELQKDCIELLNHYDSWMLQFKEEEENKKPALKDEFIFYRIDDQIAYPRSAEQHIFETIKKISKQKK